MSRQDRNQQPPSCPACGSGNVVEIVYGEPTSEMRDLADQGTIVLGGRIMVEGSPIWHCSNCGEEFGE